MAIAGMHPDGHSHVRDETQAYIQSISELERDIYLKPHAEMQMSPKKILLSLKQLYGVPESGLHLFLTYRNHHVENVAIKICTVDPCVLFKRNGVQNHNGMPNLPILQVDDSLDVEVVSSRTRRRGSPIFFGQSQES